jgi:hypothetical protein
MQNSKYSEEQVFSSVMRYGIVEMITYISIVVLTCCRTDLLTHISFDVLTYCCTVVNRH